MTEVKSLPLGITDFAIFRDHNYIYVDKTDLIAQIASYRVPIFLARPRRFGKSTLVNTFEELFSHGLERFKGLKIDTQNLWQDKTYKVLHLDFSDIKEVSKQITFSESLQNLLASAFKNLKLNFEKTEDVIGSFRSALQDIKDKDSLVLLVDEYDAPLTAVMNKKAEFEERRAILSNFFSCIKVNSGKFRFFFFTGVTRYSQVSIFSAFNNLKDLSLNPLYGAIVGYTQEEIEHYFKAYLQRSAIALNKKKNTTLYDVKLILQKLKDHYDGYSFDKECSSHVYNPWSILNFLSEPENDFDHYWLDTGGSKPSLLVNYIKEILDKKFDKSKLLNYLDSNVKILISKDKLSPTSESIDESSFPFEAILYQAGYFTLKEVDGSDFYIGLPNLEVEEAFDSIVLERLLNKSTEGLKQEHKQNAKDALKNKDLRGFKALLNAILNEFSYESVPSFKEVHFRDVYKVTLRCLDFITYSEYQTSQGRSDLCVVTDKYLYVIEFKVIGENQSKLIEHTLEDVKAQVLERKYNLRLDPLLSERQVVALACVIVNQSKDASHDKPYRGVVALEEVTINQLK